MTKARERKRDHNPEFLEALRTAPPAHELPWMRVELVGETGKVFCFAVAVHRGWIVAGAPVALKMMFGQRARTAWQLYRSRGGKLSRMDP